MFVSHSGEIPVSRITECTYKTDHTFFALRCREPVWCCQKIKITLRKAIAASSLGCAWCGRESVRLLESGDKRDTLFFLAWLKSPRSELVLRSSESVFWKNAAWIHRSDYSCMWQLRCGRTVGHRYWIRSTNSLILKSVASFISSERLSKYNDGCSLSQCSLCCWNVFKFFLHLPRHHRVTAALGARLKTTGSYSKLSDLLDLNIVLLNTHVCCWTVCRCSDVTVFFPLRSC